MKYLLALLLCFSQLAHSQEEDKITVGVNLVTGHFESGYENFNPGIYVEYKNIVGGVFRNSNGKTSVHAGYLFRKVAGSPMDVTVGGVTGYDWMPVVPLIVPSISVPVAYGVNVRFSLLMPFNKGSAGIHISMEY
jgi:hypothetical protein